MCVCVCVCVCVNKGFFFATCSERVHTLHFARKLGKSANINTAKKTITKPWKAEGSLEARQTAANMAALRDIALDTLHQEERREVEYH